jgi:hypothetical protein
MLGMVCERPTGGDGRAGVRSGRAGVALFPRRTSGIAVDMRRLFAALLLTGLVTAAPVTASYALTPAQSAALAARARADAVARTKAQQAVRARTEALAAKARADAAAKSKATVQVKLNVRAETRRRIAAADTAAKLHRQVVATRAAPNVHPGAKPDGHPPGNPAGEHRSSHHPMHAHQVTGRNGASARAASAHGR